MIEERALLSSDIIKELTQPSCMPAAPVSTRLNIRYILIEAGLLTVPPWESALADNTS
jgi:hypothetical protein